MGSKYSLYPSLLMIGLLLVAQYSPTLVWQLNIQKRLALLRGGNTELITVNWAVNGSYRVNEQFSVGAGVNVLYADAELNRYTFLLQLLV